MWVVALLAIVGCIFGQVVLPTEYQVKYQRHEIAALIHFNMATFIQNGDPGCTTQNWNVKAPGSEGPSRYAGTFNPQKLDTDQWAQVMTALGVKHAILTAKHGCGHLLWPTNVTLPDGRPYSYGVGKENSSIKYDVLAKFSQSMQKAGIGHGFYYSLTNNFYLNVFSHAVSNNSLLPGQEKVTQAEFEKIALGHVTELWSNYGELMEIWFDGGYTSDMKAQIQTLLQSKQAEAVAFNGYGVSTNPVCWIGTESGMPGGEIWSTGVADGKGDPNSQIVCPKGCDTTLQNGDTWFFEPNVGIRTLAELITVYHQTVGNNGVLELDFAIDRNGLVAPDHSQRYIDFGNWIRSCYGSALASSEGHNQSVIIVTLPAGPVVDRVVIREDISQGYRVRGFLVEYYAEASGTWETFGSGGSIGNKRILLGKPLNYSILRLTITKSVAAPIISLFAAYETCPNA